MKFSLYIIISFIALSCSKKQDAKLTCEQQRERAKTDFKNNTFIYFEYVKPSDSISYYKEFALLLKKKNIKIVFDTIVPVGCIPEINKDPNHQICYQETMNNSLHLKFGKESFDSLRIKAENIHLQNVVNQ